MAPASTSISNAAEKASAQSQSAANRVSKWVEENKNLAIALGRGSLAAGGAAAYYYLGSSGKGGSGRSSRGDTKAVDEDSNEDDHSANAAGAAGAASKNKKKKKKSSKKAAGAGEKDEPILDDQSDANLAKLSAEEISKLPEERRIPLGNYLKKLGNDQYTAKKLDEAIELYTKAIAAAPVPVYYSNRAACYANQKRYKEVVEDCDKALAIDKRLGRGLSRRAKAYEALAGDTVNSDKEGAELEQQKDYLHKAICDLTAIAILGNFADQEISGRVETLIGQLAGLKAKDILRKRERKLPSHTFVSAYLDAFRKKPLPTLPEQPSQGDQTLLLAFQNLEGKDFPHACSLFNEAVEQGLSTDELKTLGYNMRATFRYLTGDTELALEDLNKATDLTPTHVQSWVKKGSVHMELGSVPQAFEDFNKAIAANDKDPDIYYHRGQVHFIQGELKSAMEDYKKSTELDSDFLFSQVQHAVAQYKEKNTVAAEAAFRELLKKFKDCSEVYNYYGELLLDQSKFDLAERNFDKAIELELKKDRAQNVLPMVNKSLMLFTKSLEAQPPIKEDLEKAAIKLCKEAWDIDTECDVAVVTLAQFHLQVNKQKDAVSLFGKAAEMARSETELMSALVYEQATLAQVVFVERYPEQAAAMPFLAQRA